MQIKKTGFPGEGEIVICIVKKIQKTTVFVELEEYQHKEGIIHISEISPGRIRTIRDYVREGKKIVCKVLRKNERYGNLDLSLRRVTTGQKLQKLKETKLNEKCIKIIESAAKQLKLDFEKTYEGLNKSILENYENISEAFQEVAEAEDISLQNIGIEKKLADILEKIIRTRLKPKEIKSMNELSITCPTSTGIESIKKSLKKAIAFAKDKEYNLKITYISAPRYSLLVTASDPKAVESQTEEIIELLKSEIQKEKGNLEVQPLKK
jgi:translation initiation factor 2 subunit 1